MFSGMTTVDNTWISKVDLETQLEAENEKQPETQIETGQDLSNGEKTASKVGLKRKPDLHQGTGKKGRQESTIFTISFDTSSYSRVKFEAVDLAPTSDIPWGFRNDSKLTLQIEQDKGKTDCYFLESSNGKLLRLPGTENDMLVVGRQHCNDDLLVSRCAASIKFDAGDGTWKLRFTGTNTGEKDVDAHSN